MTTDVFVDVLAYLEGRLSGPFDEHDQELLCEVYSRISLLPDGPPFSEGEWGFVQYSKGTDGGEYLKRLTRRIPGGKAELERVLALPPKSWPSPQ